MIEKVINASVSGRFLDVYILRNGSVETVKIPFKKWILTPKSLDFKSTKLEGDNYYKYIKYYSDSESFWDDSNLNPDKFVIYDDQDSALVISGLRHYEGVNFEDLGVLAFDIEATTLERSQDAKILCISNVFIKNGEVLKKQFAHDEFNSQAEMLKFWAEFVQDVNPSIITGHNILGYDLPYILHVASLHSVKLRLGRDFTTAKVDRFESHFRKDGSQTYPFFNIKIHGRDIVDTLFLSIKHDFARKYPSYGLKEIVRVEGLEKPGREHFDASKIAQSYKDRELWQKIKRYCDDDAEDTLKLFKMMAPPYFNLARIFPRSLQRIVNTASGSLLNSLMVSEYLKRGYSIPKASDATEYEGAISTGIPGRYQNVFKVDVASLYPSIILHYALSDREKDPLGVFQSIVSKMTKERLENKKKFKESGDARFKSLSEAQKIVINSAYGFLGARGLTFNSPGIAKMITEKGREILKTAIKWCADQNLTLVNADTDSIAFCKLSQDKITEVERVEFLQSLNSLFPSQIKWEDDGYYDAALILKAKNYVLKKGDFLIVKGNSLKANFKEKALQEFINSALDQILNHKVKSLENLLNQYIEEIENLKDITRWAAKKTLTDSVLNPSRTQEKLILEALNGRKLQHGEKFLVYYTRGQKLKLVEDWTQDHCKKRLREKLKKTFKIIEGGLKC